MDESTMSSVERATFDRPIDDRQAVTNVELVAELGDLGALRGVSDASADLAPCTCPEPCERDHANE
jgi:hypothetical protein